jgi:hypothetical protein
MIFSYKKIKYQELQKKKMPVPYWIDHFHISDFGSKIIRFLYQKFNKNIWKSSNQ